MSTRGASRRRRQLKQDWRDVGDVDAMWGVLSSPEYRFGRGESATFFATGAVEVEHILDLAQRLGLPAGWHRCLDVGCGPGRITRSLAPHFDECIGVDISESMLTLARELNRDVENCSFVESAGESLESFASQSFDLVNASIMLQHLPDSAAIRRHIAEFVRVLAPGGVAVFQLPAAIPVLHRLQLRGRAFHLLRSLGLGAELLYERAGLHPIFMRALPPDAVARTIVASKGRLVLAESDIDPAKIRTPRYFVTPAE